MTTTQSDGPRTRVTVLGLGDMGSAIARVLLDRGHPTTVWNRTSSRSAPLVRAGASVGAAAVILPGVEIGEWAMVAAGAVVTRSVPPHALVVGSPAKPVGWVGRSGRKLEPKGDRLADPVTGEEYLLSAEGVTPA